MPYFVYEGVPVFYLTDDISSKYLMMLVVSCSGEVTVVGTLELENRSIYYFSRELSGMFQSLKSSIPYNDDTYRFFQGLHEKVFG